ncbi:unnamed protein product [Acanthoscelides obtectus]|nr:unnamed protein product [Acanthoscelides obtectus]CAK1623193.1 Equilibrative nucleoside transporter 3 [Acanthoscelides obtectus]
MFKFRNTSIDHVDQRNRTELQKEFVTLGNIFDIAPSLLTLAVVSIFGHKVAPRIRILGSMGVICSVSVFHVIFSEVNTDTWQRGFLILSLFMNTISGAAVLVFTVSNIALFSRFPQNYLKYYMYGNACGGIVTVILQCISLAIGSSPQSTALIYFSVGSVIFLYTLFLAIISSRLLLYQYYMDESIEIVKPVYTFREVWDVTKKLWVNLVNIVVNLFFVMAGVPYLVISENAGTVFADKYFVPVCTFLLSDLCSLGGRVVSGPYITKRNRFVSLMLNFLLVGLFGILLLFCRTSPKENSPLLFPHDWEYMCILSMHQIFFHFFIVSVILSVKNLVEPNQVEIGFLVMTTFSEVLAKFVGFTAVVWISLL